MGSISKHVQNRGTESQYGECQWPLEFSGGDMTACVSGSGTEMAEETVTHPSGCRTPFDSSWPDYLGGKGHLGQPTSWLAMPQDFLHVKDAHNLKKKKKIRLLLVSNTIKSLVLQIQEINLGPRS